MIFITFPFFIVVLHVNAYNIPLHDHTITVILDLFLGGGGVEDPEIFGTFHKNLLFQGCNKDLKWWIPASELHSIAVQRNQIIAT
jgi:hypothetical protein